MVKRKRGEGESAQYEPTTSEDWTSQQPPHPRSLESQGQSYPGANTLPYGSSAGVEYASSSTADVPQVEGASALNQDGADPNTGQWTASSSTAASRYPEVSNYSQQPYFFAQQTTDPSTYNSPWPPADAGTYGTQSGSYSSIASSSTTMPYFPPRSMTEENEKALEVVSSIPQTATYPNYPSEIDASSQYAYVPQAGSGSQTRGDVANNPAFLYEDASMHLKIQSLPILENLVCPNQLHVPYRRLTNTPPGHPTNPHDSQSFLSSNSRNHARQRSRRQPSLQHPQEPLRSNPQSLLARNALHRRHSHPDVPTKPTRNNPQSQYCHFHLKYPWRT